jgi:hypothetical protein
MGCLNALQRSYLDCNSCRDQDVRLRERSRISPKSNRLFLLQPSWLPRNIPSYPTPIPLLNGILSVSCGQAILLSDKGHATVHTSLEFGSSLWPRLIRQRAPKPSKADDPSRKRYPVIAAHRIFLLTREYAKRAICERPLTKNENSLCTRTRRLGNQLCFSDFCPRTKVTQGTNRRHLAVGIGV